MLRVPVLVIALAHFAAGVVVEALQMRHRIISTWALYAFSSAQSLLLAFEAGVSHPSFPDLL